MTRHVINQICKQNSNKQHIIWKYHCNANFWISLQQIDSLILNKRKNRWFPSSWQSGILRGNNAKLAKFNSIRRKSNGHCIIPLQSSQIQEPCQDNMSFATSQPNNRTIILRLWTTTVPHGNIQLLGINST